jgi:hypothetical protein
LVNGSRLSTAGCLLAMGPRMAKMMISLHEQKVGTVLSCYTPFTIIALLTFVLSTGLLG